MRFHVVNLGCKVNRVESDGFASALSAGGWTSVETSRANVVIVNTCMVTGEAEKKTRKAVRRVLRENTTALVVVTGCAASLESDTFRQMDERVYVEPDKTQVVKMVEESVSRVDVGSEKSSDGKTSSQTKNSAVLRIGKDFVTRVGVKIQDGCDNACTFCIVHKARGKAWSRPSTEIIEEVVSYEAAGVKELVLTGINLGSYCDGNLRLGELLEALLLRTEFVRFRVSSVEPHNIDERFVEVLAQADGRVCRHLHLPLQSGSSRILAEMERRYDAAGYRELVASLYSAIPTLALSTDVMVGFPSETEVDFDETMRMSQDCRFSKMHIFPFSKRQGTPAAEREDQVDHKVKLARVRRLTDLAEKLREADLCRRKGSAELVLVETRGRGTTESYHQIDTPHAALPGELVTLMIT